MNVPVRVRGVLARVGAHIGRKSKHGRHVHALALDSERIDRESVFFDALDVIIDTGGQRQDRGNTDDADAPREGSHQRAALLRHEIVEGQCDRCQERHRGLLDVLLAHPHVTGGRVERIGVTDHHAVAQIDDAVGVLFGEFGVVGDHDHQAIVGDLRQQFHDLDAGRRVERAGRFISQQDLGIIDECAGNGHPLHLAAGKLVRTLVDMVAQPDLAQGGDGPLLALAGRNTRQRQRELHVGQDGLVGDQVVALEDKSDPVVAIGIPVTILVLLCRDAVDDQVAGVVVIQTSDDVEHRRLA
ncbi:hypothetical protein SDC9_75688 [bioreactor metagenome]|uniref:Uncharacterized protein n=1 Tax=bioreactor metagenome TaxID=1076179 RepID=A0A644YMD1_9ZZZZ